MFSLLFWSLLSFSYNIFFRFLSLLTFEVDGSGTGAPLAGCCLDRVGGVVACAGRPGNGPPLRDNGPLTKGNDRVFVFQATVVIQRMQPSLPDAAISDATTSAFVTIQLLRGENMHILKRSHTSVHSQKFCVLQ